MDPYNNNNRMIALEQTAAKAMGIFIAHIISKMPPREPQASQT